MPASPDSSGFLVPALQHSVAAACPERAPRVHTLPLPPTAGLALLWQSETAAERLQPGFAALLLRAWTEHLQARPGLQFPASSLPEPASWLQAGQLFWGRAQQQLRQIYSHQPDLARLRVAAACVLLLPDAAWLWYAGPWQGQCNDVPLSLLPAAPPGQSDPAELPAAVPLHWAPAPTLRLCLHVHDQPAATLHWPAAPGSEGRRHD
ncbi:MAG: hypothetical protein IGS03_00955 [Candidatus Sericytochromatia bacterium]|nr:hypothetical protein [Candidatus Sericytochromatia bacterium]